jgi:hypothetical protein
MTETDSAKQIGIALEVLVFWIAASLALLAILAL